jgi:hypothetical protein
MFNSLSIILSANRRIRSDANGIQKMCITTQTTRLHRHCAVSFVLVMNATIGTVLSFASFHCVLCLASLCPSPRLIVPSAFVSLCPSSCLVFGEFCVAIVFRRGVSFAYAQPLPFITQEYYWMAMAGYPIGRSFVSCDKLTQAPKSAYCS